MIVTMHLGPGGGTVGAQISAVGVRVSRLGPAVVRKNGRALRDLVRENASHRPGPRVQTGQYVNAISYRPGTGDVSSYAGRISQGFEAEVYVKSNGDVHGDPADRAARLELGFVGVDSLGRHVNAPPYPHFGPALDEIEPNFIEDLIATVGI